MTILGMPILQHSQPQSAQASSGITLLSHTVPTSQRPMTAHPSTEPLHPHQPISNIEGLPKSGTSPSRPTSMHLSLYEQSRNPLPAPQPFVPPRTATGRTSSNSVHHFDPDVTKDVGNESTGSSEQSHNLHQSYSCPPEQRYEYITNETSGEGTLYKLPHPTTPFPDTTPYPDGTCESTPKSLLLHDDSNSPGNGTA